MSKSIEEFKKTDFIEETSESSKKIKEFDSVLKECLVLLKKYVPDTEDNSIVEESPEKSMNRHDSVAFSPGITPFATVVGYTPHAGVSSPPVVPFSTSFNPSENNEPNVFKFNAITKALEMNNNASKSKGSKNSRVMGNKNGSNSNGSKSSRGI